MDERSQERLMLRLAVEHLYANGMWPKLADIHRRVYKEPGEDFEVGPVARRLVPSPYVQFTDLGEQFTPPITALRNIPAARPLLESLVLFIQISVERYLTAETEAVVMASNLRELGADPRSVELIPAVVGGVPYLYRSVTSGVGTWSIQASDHIVKLRHVGTIDDLCEFIARTHAESQRQMTELKEAHYRMLEPIQAGRPGSPSTSEGTHEDKVGLLESHPVIRLFLLVGGIAGAALAIVTVVKSL